MKMITKAEEGKPSSSNKMNDKTKREYIDQAFINFSTACVDDPQFAMAYFKRGKCYMMMHDYKRALYDFSAAILNETRAFNKQPILPGRSEGGLASFYMHGGMCNYYLGQYEEALAHYEIAISKNPDDDLLSKIFYNKGLANASLMRYDDAISDQLQAYEKVPDKQKGF